MRHARLAAALAGLLGTGIFGLFSSGCTLNHVYDQCEQDTDCPAASTGRPQFCTNDHLCVPDTPESRLCTVSLPAAPAEDAVHIGALLPYPVGTTDPAGQARLRSLQLAAGQIDDLADIQSARRIALHLCDISGSPGDALNSLRLLLDRYKVVAVIGPDGPKPLADVIGTAVAAQVPLLSPASTESASANLAGRGFLFRLAPVETQQASPLARLVPNGTVLGLANVEDTYGNNVRRSFLSAWTNAPRVSARRFPRRRCGVGTAGAVAVVGRARGGCLRGLLTGLRDGQGDQAAMMTLRPTRSRSQHLPARWTLLPTAALLFHAACSQPGETPAELPDLLSPAVDMSPAVVEVSGRRSITYVSDSGATTVAPVDLTSATLEALVAKSDGSGYTVYPGSGKSDGTFTIPGVPAGASYYLHLNSSESGRHLYFYTSARSIDLGYFSNQRAGATIGAAGTQLVWSSVPGLDTWSSGDELQYYSADNDVYFGGTTPAVGATTLSVTQNLSGVRLIDASAGDHLYVLQRHGATTSGGAAVKVVTKAVALSNLKIVDAATTTLTAAQASFTAPPMQSASFDFRCSQFAAFKSAAAPAANLNAAASCDLYVLAAPGGPTLSFGDYSNTADLLSYSTSGTSDVNLGQASYGNPFPASYGPYGYAAGSFGGAYTLPGATASTTIAAGVVVRASLATLTAGPITPSLGLPTGLKLNGADATTITAAVGTTPTLSWSPPQLGTPTYYTVQVIQLSLRPGTTRTMQTAIARITTSQTQLVLPPGLLTTGGYYVFSVASTSRPNADPARPAQNPLPSTVATALTAMVTP